MAIWPRLVGFLVIGYLSMTRSFAYLGVPRLNIFIGEIVLAAFVFLKPRVALGTWAASLLRPSPLNALGLALLLFMSYGVWQVGRGVLGGSSLFLTLKFFIFNYYALYLLLGIWVGMQAPDYLLQLLRAVAWVNGIYGLMWAVALKTLAQSYFVPGSNIALFGQPGGSAVAVLGLLCFERNLRAVWPLLALNVMVTLIMQMRAEWLGLAVGMVVWGLLTGRLGRVVVTGLAGLAVVGMLAFAGIQLPGRTGGAVSLGETVARVVAPIDPELAKELAPDVDHAGTADWRRKWWDAIWASVHSTPMLEAFGHGYGFDLLGLASADVRGARSSWDTRTPHSVFYFALGYTGWVGVILFGALQLTILRLLWASFRVGGQSAGVAFWAMGMATAFVDPSFDTPYRAIPFYLLVGMAIAPGLQAKGELHARLARPQLLSVARR
jgi:O-Antigen ligase